MAASHHLLMMFTEDDATAPSGHRIILRQGFLLR
jgi:hypothetical protein